MSILFTSMRLAHIMQHELHEHPPFTLASVAVQVSGALLPLQNRCTWKYDHLTTVQQQNIAKCYSDVVNELAAYQAYENKLFNDVYPVLVRICLP
jgi:hypothetical protein